MSKNVGKCMIWRFRWMESVKVTEQCVVRPTGGASLSVGGYVGSTLGRCYLVNTYNIQQVALT